VLQLLPAGGNVPSLGALIVGAFAHDSRAIFKTAIKKPATDKGFGTELVGTFGHLMMSTKVLTYR
jgi:hypothetical protein